MKGHKRKEIKPKKDSIKPHQVETYYRTKNEIPENSPSV
jgi:hypothetical protein